MKKKITILFLSLMVLATTLFAISSTFVGAATNGVLTFGGFNVGTVTGQTAYTYDNDTYFKSIGVMGSTVTNEIATSGTDKVFKTTSTSDTGMGGGHYIGLKNFTEGEYRITITLKFSDGATLRSGKATKVRFDADDSSDVVLDSLYSQATADANGFKTISFDKITSKTYSWIRIYNQFKIGGSIEVKEIKIVSLTSSGTPDAEEEVNLTFDLTDYVIVYGAYEAEGLMLANPTYANYTEWDFNRLIAEEFKANLKSAFNVDLPIVKDTESTPADKEILIGKTNRKDYKGYLGLTFVKNVKIVDGINPSFSYSATDPFKYAYGLQGNDIYMVGGCYATTYEATNLFFNYLKENLVDNKVDLTANWKIEGSKDLVVIGCIGDSITQGTKSLYNDEGGATYVYFSYPAYLQRMNWKTTYVYNLGRSGRTMRSDHTNSYQDCWRWKTATQIVKDVLDYVIIQLGTNDTKLFPNTWTDADNKQFIDDFFVLVDTISETNKDVKYILSNCPMADNGKGSGAAFILPIQAECVNQAKAKGYTIELFDMRTFSTENMPMSTHFDADRLHPNSTGYYEMAKGLDGALKEFFPSTPDTPDTPDTPTEEKGGCGSVITATSAVLASVLLAGAVVVLKKKH
ncbi:MAG: SGNH/GDSL hydrolase family protein [Clostridiales bacterium]|nr:SGNH/GDSL hydrolase family protein [Clostridiales bacterium]